MATIAAIASIAVPLITSMMGSGGSKGGGGGAQISMPSLSMGGGGGGSVLPGGKGGVSPEMAAILNMLQKQDPFSFMPQDNPPPQTFSPPPLNISPPYEF